MNTLDNISRFLSLLLRHKPGTVGLVLDENGWADVNELLEKMKPHGFHVSKEQLEEVVFTNNKKRFAFNEDHTKIRASQGHSIAVDLKMEPVTPPAFLYHGTGEKSVASILATGLEKRSRQHVHLSADKETALAVGSRHGKPVVLVINARQMQADGFLFYLSANKVWLTDAVPVLYISLPV